MEAIVRHHRARRLLTGLHVRERRLLAPLGPRLRIGPAPGSAARAKLAMAGVQP